MSTTESSRTDAHTATAPRCFLCQHSRSVELDALTPSEIVRTWREVGVDLSPDGRVCLNRIDKIRHLRCEACGFQYFDPIVPGDSAYYTELQTQFPDYYPRQCAAFDRALAFARNHSVNSVFDIGCGAGFFLDQARDSGWKTAGLDLNAKAVADCRSRGHDVICSTMAAFADSNHGAGRSGVPFATAFEVVEHVPDPVAFVREAARLLAPGGWLAIAVPFNEGVHSLCELEPHQWPPHHLTRWRIHDLHRLGELAGLTTVESGADARHGWHMRFFMKLQNRLECALGRRQRVSSPWWPELVCFVYRISLMKHWGPKKGLGIYAFYQKPS